MNCRVGVAILTAVATLVLTPSCGSETDEREMRARRYMREQVTGTWSVRVEGSGTAITLRLNPEQNDALIPMMSGCSASLVSFVAPAHACVPEYKIPVDGSSDSGEPGYVGALAGLASAYRSSGGSVTVRVTFASSGRSLEAQVENGVLTGVLYEQSGYLIGNVSGERVP